jgi:hypothetical protein
MKKTVIITMFTISCVTQMVSAQGSATHIDKMAAFRNWEGNWKGTSTIQRGPEGSQKASVEEHIEFKLNGTLLVVEGIGKIIEPETKKEKIVHHAFGILNYDQVSGQYKFQTYLVDGKSTAAWFTADSETKYQWGFDVPEGKIRYTIILDGQKGTWNEIGEYSRDETTWHKFMEMNLTKI